MQIIPGTSLTLSCQQKSQPSQLQTSFLKHQELAERIGIFQCISNVQTYLPLQYLTPF